MSLYQVFQILGGIGLFLFGMSLMSSGLSEAAGEKMQVLLEKATSNRFKAILIGFIVTLTIQSSSATDVMVIGFVNSGFMNLTQAIGVIMGANIGTTVTPLLLSM
ncbi:MAG: Na/Pi symporter, partial [Duodenibacillus sp.]|nr:Na/Pi symporter [Duodenibacillus sp.]